MECQNIAATLPPDKIKVNRMENGSDFPAKRQNTAEDLCCGNVVVLYRGAKHNVALPERLGDLRARITAVTGVAAECVAILVRGKKIGPATPDSTTVADCLIKSGTTIMLSTVVPGSIGEGVLMSSTLAKVRDIEKEVKDAEKEVGTIEERLQKVGKGFLDKTQTAEMVDRIGRDGRAVEETLMRLVIDADSLTCPENLSNAPHGNAQWRAERKSLVVHAQAVLRRCDELQRDIKDIVNDEFGEFEWRRGKKS
jgi:hypothetical protein